MLATAEFKYDVASDIIIGRRETQEDAISVEFGNGFGCVVLSDGMGGHEAGDVASQLVVKGVLKSLKRDAGDVPNLRANTAGVLRNAVMAANEALRAHTDNRPETQGMGATVVAAVFLRDKLFWISVGDSPLYLLRDGELRQLNEDHSLAPQIDFMVRSGLIPEDVGRDHPERNCLTSALAGDEIPLIDCPQEPFRLCPGDLVIAASDGLQFLTDEQIRHLLAARPKASASQLSGLLMTALKELDDPNQDNTCLSVIRAEMPNAPAERDTRRTQRTPARQAARRKAPAMPWAARIGPFFDRLMDFAMGLTK